MTLTDLADSAILVITVLAVVGAVIRRLTWLAVMLALAGALYWLGHYNWDWGAAVRGLEAVWERVREWVLPALAGQ